MKVKLSSSLPTLLALALVGCGSSETKDPENGDPVEQIDESGENGENGASSPAPAEKVDLTGKWVRKSPDGGEVVFDCVDAGATLSLKRDLAGNKDIKYYEVELDRQGDKLVGKARFRYADPELDAEAGELSNGWELTKRSDYSYDAKVEYYEMVDGKEERGYDSYAIEIAPKNPKKVEVTDPSKESGSPASSGAAIAPPKDAPISEAEVKDQLTELFGDDEAKSKAAMAALRAQGAPADRVILNASYDVENPIKRARAGLLLALRQNPEGLTALQEVKSDASSLGITESETASRLYKLGVAFLVPIPGLDRSPATIDKVLADTAGSEAMAWAKKVEEKHPELLVLGWLKSEQEKERQIAEAILFPGGVALNEQFNLKYEGEIYNALDENKERRDAAADQFVTWFDANARAKFTN